MTETSSGKMSARRAGRGPLVASPDGEVRVLEDVVDALVDALVAGVAESR